MQVATHQTSSSAPVIAELNQSNQNNQAKPTKKNGLADAQVSAMPSESNNLTQGNLARLLASCGDCI